MGEERYNRRLRFPIIVVVFLVLLTPFTTSRGQVPQTVGVPIFKALQVWPERLFLSSIRANLAPTAIAPLTKEIYGLWTHSVVASGTGGISGLTGLLPKDRWTAQNGVDWHSWLEQKEGVRQLIIILGIQSYVNDCVPVENRSSFRSACQNAVQEWLQSEEDETKPRMAVEVFLKEAKSRIRVLAASRLGRDTKDLEDFVLKEYVKLWQYTLRWIFQFDVDVVYGIGESSYLCSIGGCSEREKTVLQGYFLRSYFPELLDEGNLKSVVDTLRDMDKALKQFISTNEYGIILFGSMHPHFRDAFNTTQF